MSKKTNKNMGQNFKMIAKTFYGFEDILAEELLALGAQKIIKGNRNVSFFGDKGFLYKSNLCLRTALKILKPQQGLNFYLILIHHRRSRCWS